MKELTGGASGLRSGRGRMIAMIEIGHRESEVWGENFETNWKPHFAENKRGKYGKEGTEKCTVFRKKRSSSIKKEEATSRANKRKEKSLRTSRPKVSLKYRGGGATGAARAS